MGETYKRTLYLDPELLGDVKIQMVKDKIEGREKIYRNITELVTDIWEKFFRYQYEIPLKGYRYIKGKIIKTPQMKQTSINISVELNEKIEKFLSHFSREMAKEGDMNFSLITNELIQRIYLDNELY